MALNERKRQQKLAKKKAKRKEVAKAARRSLSPGFNPFGLLANADRLARAADGPIHECLVPRGLFDGGLGSVLLSRKLDQGLLAVAVFLLDVHCLGVKDAFLRIVTPLEYGELVKGANMQQALESVAPAYARKLIEDSIAYARSLGLNPHPDYESAKRILGAIDPAECRESFEFGKDGKPFYVSGPNDTPARIRQIVATLDQHCGPGGYHYLAMLRGGDDFGEFDEDDGDYEAGEWADEEEE
jgi:hypothetical protein